MLDYNEKTLKKRNKINPNEDEKMERAKGLEPSF